MAPRLVVVLVRPKHPGNVGSVARVLRNFGLEELWLVEPCALGEDARRMAMHAWDLLDRARTLDRLEDALEDLDLAVGTASDLASNEKHDYIRVPMALRAFGDRVHELEGTVGLVFGPEDFGLTNAELELCDALITIPAHPQHPSLNLSHAVAVVCYELTQARHPVKRPRQASREEQEKLLEFVDRILDHLQLPEHRKRTTRLTFRKLLGRAMLSKWEYHRLMGVFNGALRAMEEVHRQGKSVRGLRRVHDQPGRKRPPPAR
ncbi:MAG TPA: RNA methyltransferase [Candidatus Thermoplasmatota archaeon]|nr:RNA methyltransferase [Candidatus Thermoplasmatota archaeon]